MRIVLVGTQHPGNIGSAARAMKTMGLSRLVLVAPEQYPAAKPSRWPRAPTTCSARRRCSPPWPRRWPTAAACWAAPRAAAGSQLEELAPARRRRDARWRSPPAARWRWCSAASAPGWSNEELQLCHAAVHIPANPDYSSLNLAAAVQVLAYELRLCPAWRCRRSEPLAAVAAPQRVAGQPCASWKACSPNWRDTLDDIDFHKGRAPDSAMRKLRRLFLRANLNEQEVRLLRGILADAQRMARLAGENGA